MQVFLLEPTCWNPMTMNMYLSISVRCDYQCLQHTASLHRSTSVYRLVLGSTIQFSK
jgi:hypothetical protein